MISTLPPTAANLRRADGDSRRSLRFAARPAFLAVTAMTVAATAAPALAQQARERGAVRQRDVGAEMERHTRKILREKGPAVASIRVVTNAATRPRLALPGVTIAPPGGQSEQVDASCFVATANGHIVTTSSALFDAAHIEVHFYDGTVRDADLIGVDAPFQIAVLRTRAPDQVDPLCVPERTTDGQPKLGWFFQATDGRPDADYMRVRAARSRGTSYDRYLSASSYLQPGAAGGPLVSATGRLMGMAVREVRHRADTRTPSHTRAQWSRPSTLFVRGADIHAAVEQIVRIGRVRRPLLGVVMDNDTNRIDQLLPGGPAHLAGLVEGDRVVGVAGTPVSSLTDVTRALLRRTIGETVRVDIRRGEKLMARPVELADVTLPPPPQVAPMPGAELQVSRVKDTTDEWTVTIVDLVEGSSLHLAGVQIGDKLVRVDGRDALRFLQRHRIRPEDAFPREVEIERDDTRHVLTLAK